MSRPAQSSLPFPREAVDLYRFEREAAEQGYRVVAGVDEAGRGPLAGPVVAAAVILREPIDGLMDSKKLTAARREALFHEIMGRALAVGVGMADAPTIDRVNILQATLSAMGEALQKLDPAPDCLLVDAVTIPKVAVFQRAIIRGDAMSASIAAASIVAKVTRDRLMDDLHLRYPHYGFDVHKGYGTRLHVERIHEHGPSEVHRKSFRVPPVSA